MKFIAILFTLNVFLETSTFAASSLKVCSNRGNSIEIIEGEESIVKIQTDFEKFVSIPSSQLNIEILTSKVLKPAAHGCDSSELLEEIRLSRKDGKALPHSFTQTAEDGKLKGFFLCEESTDALPQIDESGNVFCY